MHAANAHIYGNRKPVHLLQGNLDNPLGLINVAGKVYKPHGFINYMDGRDIHQTPELVRYQPSWAFGLALHGYNSADEESRRFEVRLSKQLKALKLDSQECLYYNLKAAVLVIFLPHKDPISFMTKTATEPCQAMLDFLTSNKCIPQILNDYRLYKEFSKQRDLQVEESTFYCDYLDEEKLRKFLTRNNEYKPKPIDYKKLEEEQLKRDLAAKESEATIVKFADYSAYKAEHGIDLMDLHKRIVSQARRAGGFVEFNYKGQSFSIPKMPLIAWAIRHKKSIQFEYNNEVWRTICPREIKCADDDSYHSDWWIGAGIPIDAYNLHGSTYSHYMFNKEISMFASEIAKRNTLESFTVLSGRLLPPVSGRLMNSPSSVDQVKEGDILILPRGDVEFDAFLKKACRNGKGAVILEIGNGAAHLSIVANELGYRVILLPNARELLLGVPKAFVDMENTLIKPILDYN